MDARIFQPAKSAMQSGRGHTRQWILEFTDKGTHRGVDPVMGWTSSSDTRPQIRLEFDTREQAIHYARTERLTYRVEAPRETKRLIKSYSENFSPTRKQPWTH